MKKVLVIFMLFVFSTDIYAASTSYAGLGAFLVTSAATTATGVIVTTGAAVMAAQNEPETFVQNNFDTLTIDVARGNGDTINALAVLVGVEDVESFGKRLQANFDVIYPSYDIGHEYVAYEIVALS